MPYLDNALDVSNIFFACIAIVSFLGGFTIEKITSPFLYKKAENLATKQDVGEITRITEEVRQEFLKEIKELDRKTSLLVEEIRANSQLRLVNADQRLKAHQEAHTLWLELLKTVGVDTEDSREVIEKCLNWWANNCLYLSKDLDYDFLLACLAAKKHPRLLEYDEKKSNLIQVNHVSPEETIDTKSNGCEQSGKAIKENLQKIEDLGNLIRESVQLPPLSSKELSMLIKSVSVSDQESEDQ